MQKLRLTYVDNCYSLILFAHENPKKDSKSTKIFCIGSQKIIVNISKSAEHEQTVKVE